MRKERQISFLPPPILEFGGSLLENKRKSERILALKRPIHLVAKCDISTSGTLLKYKAYITKQIIKWSDKFDIKVYNYAIYHNHFHFNIKISSRENYIKFIRALNGILAKALKVKFLLRPYTKIINWGQHFRRLTAYIQQNNEEATGQRPYKPRKPKGLKKSNQRKHSS